MSFFQHSAFLRLRTLVSGTPRRPRHPLLRLVLGLLGIALLLALLAVGLVVGLAMLLGGQLLRLFTRPGKPARGRGRILEGDYRVVGKPSLAR
ncbi:hypothetical protein [Thermomonas alba]|uniref:hypothetical protein n=1 Tax=Thermomonas alba TaxID=2888525 RepID=UPI001F03F4D2|nr:hypothetical protein [Thermomonas alba]